MAAEYVMSEGNYEVILCERGVRTFADHTRNTLDLSIVPAVQRVSHLPILVDPSHGTGKRDSVLPMARAAWRRARTAFWWKCTTIRRRRSPMGRSRFIPISLPA